MRYLFGLVIALAVIFFIFSTISFSEVTAALSKFPVKFIIPLILLAAGILVLKTWRLSLLLRSNDIRIGFWQTFKVLVAGNSLSSLPGGEMFRSVLLSYETGKSVHQTGSSVLAQSFLEVLTAVLLFTAGTLIYEDFLLVGVGVFAATLVFFSLIAHTGLLEFARSLLPDWKIVKRGYRFIVKIRSDYSKIIFTSRKIYKLKLRFNKKNPTWFQRAISLRFSFSFGKSRFVPSTVLLQVLGISLTGHFLGGCLLWLIANTSGSTISVMDTFFVYSLGIVISSLGGIIPGGLGVTEGGMVGVLVIFSVAFPQAVAIVLIYRFITLLLNILYGLVFIAIFYVRPIFLERKVI